MKDKKATSEKHVLITVLLFAALMLPVSTYASDSNGSNRMLLTTAHFYADPKMNTYDENGELYTYYILPRFADLLLGDERYMYSFSRFEMRENVTEQEFIGAIDDAFSGSSDDDTLYLYYNGHGVNAATIEQSTWEQIIELFTDTEIVNELSSVISFTDAVFEDIASLAKNPHSTPRGYMSAEELQRVLDQYAGHKVVILDACVAGSFYEHFLHNSDYTIITGSYSKSMYSQPIHDKIPGTVAWAPTMGFFLTQGMGYESSAIPADKNEDGLVSMQELAAYISTMMLREPEEKRSLPQFWMPDKEKIFWANHQAKEPDELSLDYLEATESKHHRYVYFREDVDWHTAKQRCEAMGGYLATIASHEEYEKVLSILPENETHFFIWLGASDFAEEGIWQWVTGEAFSFTDWHEGEPNGGERENVLLLTNYYQSRWGWNDADGMVPGYQGFVCEWDE